MTPEGKYKHGKHYPQPDGKRHGRGTRVWVSGNRYEGDWADDKMHGEGLFTSENDGITYKGSYVRGKREGFGEQVYTPPPGLTSNGWVCPMGSCHEVRSVCGERAAACNRLL